MTVSFIAIYTLIALLVVLIAGLLIVLGDIRTNQTDLLKEYASVTNILGTYDIPSKPTRYEAGDIVVVKDSRTHENSLVHLRNVYCHNKTWLYSGIKIEFIKAPLKFGIRKIPTFITTISGIREENIQPIEDISMKVFKWKKEDL